MAATIYAPPTQLHIVGNEPACIKPNIIVTY